MIRKCEGNYGISQHGAFARIAAKAVHDVLFSVDDIKGGRSISAARIGHGRGIEGPQDFARPGIRGMEEPVAFAEENQVAGYSHTRVGSKVIDGNLPSDLSRDSVYRSVDAVVDRAGYTEG